jgi:hypothetical protein
MRTPSTSIVRCRTPTAFTAGGEVSLKLVGVPVADMAGPPWMSIKLATKVARAELFMAVLLGAVSNLQKYEIDVSPEPSNLSSFTLTVTLVYPSMVSDSP